MFEVGQSWTLKAAHEIGHARLVVGAVLTFEGGEEIVCCSVEGALQRMPDGSLRETTVPFLPMTGAAFADSVGASAGTGEVPAGFAPHYETWAADEGGLTYFTVQFEGSLDRIIARQMSAIVGEDA